MHLPYPNAEVPKNFFLAIFFIFYLAGVGPVTDGSETDGSLSCCLLILERIDKRMAGFD